MLEIVVESDQKPSLFMLPIAELSPADVALAQLPAVLEVEDAADAPVSQRAKRAMMLAKPKVATNNLQLRTRRSQVATNKTDHVAAEVATEVVAVAATARS